MNVLSLFDGMSCGRIALDRAGIKVDNYFASEVDKYAISVAKHNYPDIKHIGDVTQVKASDLPKIDLIIGGSPCQGFSFAGKQLNFDDPRSVLFFEFVRLLKEIQTYNPNVLFLLENVKMKKEYQDVISELMRVEPVKINSALVSAQNRERLYWSNIPTSSLQDKGILLKHIVENGKVDRDKSHCIGAHESKGTTLDTYNGIRKGVKRQIIFLDSHKSDKGLKCIGALPCKKWKDDGKILQRNFSQGERIYSIEGKSPTLTANGGGTAGCSALIQVGKATDINGHDLIKRVYSIEGKSPTLNTMTGGNREPKIAIDEKYWRKLTPLECERLQTVPDNEIICIFALCLARVKNYVNAVEQNPKLLKLALSAEKEKLNEFVKLANQNTRQNNQKTKCIVQQGVDMMTQRQINQCTKINQKENNTTVNNVENIVMCKSQNQEADSVPPNAFINITEGRIMRFGTEELHRNDSHSTTYLNGKKPLVLFGSEIMELVKDVDAGMKKNSDMIFTSTTLSALSISSLEQMLATYYLFAKNAITGYIPNETNQKSLSVQFQINDGYTNHVSNSQRYKMLGNGWTVDVIAEAFFKHLDLY